MWEEVVKRLRRKASKERSLTYQEGAVGITALLSCPVKWELSQKFDVKSEAVEIDDGYVWERQVKEVFKELFPQAKEEKDLVYKIDGYTVHGHLDLFVEFENEVWGIELKSPKLLLLKDIPNAENGFYVDDGLVLHNPQYYKQAKVQRFLLQELYPDRNVRSFIFYKALCKHKNYLQKLYVLSEVKESVSKEEFKALIKAFHEDKSPRYANECESYCVFHRESLCEGKEFKPSYIENVDPQTAELLKAYYATKEELKTLENNLKKAISGSFTFGGKQIGWIKRNVVDLDLKKLLTLMSEEDKLKTLQVKWQFKDKLIEKYGQDVIEEQKEVIEWKL